MIKLKDAIKVNNYAMRLKVDDTFSDRIMGNYDAFDVKVNPASLLYLAISEPEIFLMDGGINVGGSRVSVNNKFYTELSLISALTKFISKMESHKVTYKDKVYVEQILSKFGITDTREFITKLQSLVRDEKHYEELLKLYKRDGRSLKTLLEITKEKNGAAIDISQMYMQVLQRMGYAENSNTLYEIRNAVRQFRNNADRSYQSTAMHKKVSDRLELMQLKDTIYNEVSGEALFLQNPYEYPENSDNDTDTQAMIKRLLKAVIYNMTSSLLSINKYSFYKTNDTVSQSDVSTFFVGSGNTIFEKFKESYRSGKYYQSEIDKINDIYRESTERELSVLHEFEGIKDTSVDLLREVIKEISTEERAAEVSDAEISDVEVVSAAEMENLSVVTEETKIDTDIEKVTEIKKEIDKAVIDKIRSIENKIDIDKLVEIRKEIDKAVIDKIQSIENETDIEIIINAVNKADIENLENIVNAAEMENLSIVTDESKVEKVAEITNEINKAVIDKIHSIDNETDVENRENVINTAEMENISLMTDETEISKVAEITSETDVEKVAEITNEINKTAETSSETSTETDIEKNTEITNEINKAVIDKIHNIENETVNTAETENISHIDKSVIEKIDKVVIAKISSIKHGTYIEKVAEVRKELKEQLSQLTKREKEQLLYIVEQISGRGEAFVKNIDYVKSEEIESVLDSLIKLQYMAESSEITNTQVNTLNNTLNSTEDNRNIESAEIVHRENYTEDTQIETKENTVKTSEEIKTFKDYIESIEKKNREMFSNIEQIRENTQVQERVSIGIDRERTQESLAESVLDITEKSVSKTSERSFNVDIKSDKTTAEESIIALADEDTQRLYRTIMNIQNSEENTNQILLNREDFEKTEMVLAENQVSDTTVENTETTEKTVSEVSKAEDTVKTVSKIEDTVKNISEKISKAETVTRKEYSGAEVLSSLYELLGISKQVIDERNLVEINETFEKDLTELVHKRRNINETVKSIMEESTIAESTTSESITDRNVSHENTADIVYENIYEDVYEHNSEKVYENIDEMITHVVTDRVMRDVNLDEINNYIVSGQKEDMEHAVVNVIARVREDDIYRASERTISNVTESMIHKQLNSIDEEEILEKMRIENRRRFQKIGSSTDISTTNVVRNKDEVVLETTVNDRNKTIIKSREEIQKMINERIRTEIDPLSEKIYKKLEYRLRDERRRRGF